MFRYAPISTQRFKNKKGLGLGLGLGCINIKQNNKKPGSASLKSQSSLTFSWCVSQSCLEIHQCFLRRH